MADHSVTLSDDGVVVVTRVIKNVTNPKISQTVFEFYCRACPQWQNSYTYPAVEFAERKASVHRREMTTHARVGVAHLTREEALEVARAIMERFEKCDECSAPLDNLHSLVCVACEAREFAGVAG